MECSPLAEARRWDSRRARYGATSSPSTRCSPQGNTRKRSRYIADLSSGVAPEFEHWVNRERDRLTVCHATTLESLAEDCEARDDFRAAAEHWRVMSAHHPWDGRVVLRLMLAVEAAGDRAQAIRRADAYSVLVREELGAVPDQKVTALAARLREASGHATGSDGIPQVAAVTNRARGAVAAATSDPGRSTPVAQTRRVRRVVTALLIAVGAVGGLLWRQPIRPQAERKVSRLETPVRRNSLAVLPLKNYSGDPAQEDFAAGMTDELTTTLSKIEGLHVIAHQSVRQFKLSDRPVPEIARALGVGHLVFEFPVSRGEESMELFETLASIREEANV